MKKPLIFVCLLAVCLIGYVGNVMYQRFSVRDRVVHVVVKGRGGFAEDSRTFSVIEVTIKGKNSLTHIHI